MHVHSIVPRHTQMTSAKYEVTKKTGDASAKTTVVAATSDDTPGAAATTCCQIGYITEQVACAADSTEDTSNGGWCVDGGATVVFVDPARVRNVRENISSYRTLASGRSHVSVGGKRKVQGTGFDNGAGAARNGREVQVRIEILFLFRIGDDVPSMGQQQAAEISLLCWNIVIRDQNDVK